MVECFDVDPSKLGHIWPAIEVIRAACEAVEVNFFIVGAAARDLLLEHVHGSGPLRATTDVDAAVAVGSWREYDSVVSQLVELHSFSRAKEPHRVRLGTTIIDIVPFGDITSVEGTIVWPGGSTAMSVVGFAQAFDAAVGIRVDGGQPVRVASLPGVGVLKLVAWGEAPHRRRQDPVDLCAIIMNYDSVIGESLYTIHSDLLEAEDFDLTVASAQIFGRDMAPLLGSERLKHRILQVLERNTDDDASPLALAMGSECHRDYSFRIRLVKALLQGIQDPTNTDLQ